MSATKKAEAEAQLSHRLVEHSCGADDSLSPIIYLHTVEGHKEMWLGIPEEISNATKRKSYVLDLRCHGDNAPSDKFSLQLLVEDLHHFMGSQGLKRAILIGHGLGGQAACMFALKHPEMVELLVNIDGALKNEIVQETNGITLKYLNMWRQGVTGSPEGSTPSHVIKHAVTYMRENGLHIDDLEEDVYKHSIKKREDGSGYDVKHHMPPIVEFLEKSAAGQEILDLEGRFEGWALFLMGDLSMAKE